MRTCTKCRRDLPLTDFHRKGSGLQPSCKECQRAWAKAHYALTADRQRAAALRRYAENRPRARAQQAAYYAANRDKIRAQQAAWWAANEFRPASQDRYRARKRAATVVVFTPAQLDARMSMFGRKCWMCGGPFEHVDHVKPLVKGGPHMLANLRPACRLCNSQKHAKWDGPRAMNSFYKQGTVNA